MQNAECRMKKTGSRESGKNLDSLIPIPYSLFPVFCLSFFILYSTFCITFSAFAHKVNIFAYIEGETVHTESYFNDGVKCSNAAILVYDKSGALLLEGTTDADGRFDFQLPRREDLRIAVEADMGHRAEYLLTKREIGRELVDSDLTKNEDAPAPTLSQAKPRKLNGDESRQAGLTPVPSLAGEMEKIIEKKLAPLAAKIDRIQKMQEQATFRDIIGGVGYIVGVMGLLAYWRSRKK
jgi:nickel transport protein